MGHGCAERGTEVSPQDHWIHITETPLGLGLLRGGPQLLSLELVPKAPNRAARDCLMPSLPKFILRIPPVLSAKKQETATNQPAYLRSADASADPRSNPFRLLAAEQ